jgi:hypothetical protein
MTNLMTGDTHVKVETPTRDPVYTAPGDLKVGPAMRIPVQRVSTRDVILDPQAMEVGRAYSYQLDGSEYVAIRRADERVDFYELPSR